MVETVQDGEICLCSGIFTCSYMFNLSIENYMGNSGDIVIAENFRRAGAAVFTFGKIA